MNRLALFCSLFWVVGCGSTVPAGIGSRDPAVAEMAAELGAGSLAGLVALGHDEIVVPASVFGTTTDVIGIFDFVAAKDAQESVHGRYRFTESAEGTTTHYAGPLTCAQVYDFNGLTGNRAKVGGRVDSSDDPGIPVGTFIWWQAIDNRDLGRADQSTLAGFGDEAANTAFCASSNPPRFGPFDVVEGDIRVGSGL